MNRNVPYYSQWADPAWNEAIVMANADPCGDSTWVKHGFPSEQEYRFWSKRVCGLACLESILEYWTIPRPSRYLLLQEAIQCGVYVLQPNGSVVGLVYQPFVLWIAKRFGLSAQAVTYVSVAEFLERMPPDGFGIASVSLEIRSPMLPRSSATNGGHLVLAIDQKQNEVIFHNPSGTGSYQAYASLDYKRFGQFFAGRGIIIESGNAW